MLGIKSKENTGNFSRGFKNLLIDKIKMLESVGCDITEHKREIMEPKALKKNDNEILTTCWKAEIVVGDVLRSIRVL